MNRQEVLEGFTTIEKLAKNIRIELQGLLKQGSVIGSMPHPITTLINKLAEDAESITGITKTGIKELGGHESNDPAVEPDMDHTKKRTKV